jgi:hypothetical protein
MDAVIPRAHLFKLPMTLPITTLASDRVTFAIEGVSRFVFLSRLVYDPRVATVDMITGLGCFSRVTKEARRAN